MNKELYDKIFARLDSLGAIRKDLSFGCEIKDIGGYINSYDSNWKGYIEPRETILGHPPILSDCLKPMEVSDFEYCERVKEGIGLFIMEWDYSKPYLHQQSDELGEKLFELLS